jgi:protocatechuate 3,4-dioxygenase beta subunit
MMVQIPFNSGGTARRRFRPFRWLVGATTLCLLAVVVPRATPAVERTAEPVPPDGPAIRVGGVVVTPDGKPARGAMVVLRAKTAGQQHSIGMKHDRDVLARTTTDAAGGFAFDGIGIPPRLEGIIDSLLREAGGVELLAWADGWGMAWVEVKGLTRNAPVRLTLSPEAKVHGVVRDKAGQAVPEARLTVYGMTRATADASGVHSQPGDLNLTYSEVSPVATTDASGQFTLRRLPTDYRVAVFFECPGLALNWIYIDTGDHKDLTEIRTRTGGGRTYPVLRSPVTVSVERQRLIRVKVVDHAGQPVRDGGVQMTGTEPRFFAQKTVNEHGEAHLSFAEPGRYRLTYSGDPFSPRLGTVVTADIPAGADPFLIEVRLPEAKWLTGRVVDADTGKGIAGVPVAYARQQDPASKDAPARSECVSDPRGQFRIPVAIGRGSLRYRHRIFGYLVPIQPPVLLNRNASKNPAETPGRGKPEPTAGRPGLDRFGALIDVPNAGQPDAVTLSLSRGLSIRGVVRDPDGKPAAGAVVQVHYELGPPVPRPAPAANAARRPAPPIRHTAAGQADANGRFEVTGLPPRIGALLTVRGDAGAARTTLATAPDHPADRARSEEVEIRLKPGVAVTGRVLYKGQPRAGVVMKLFHTYGQEARRSYSMSMESLTDANGSYRFAGLEMGDQYHLEMVDPDGMTAADWPDRGRVKTVGEGRAEIRVPDAHLLTHGQTLRGVVVDPQGKPVAGIAVHAGLGPGRGFARPRSGPAPWTESDEKGRFELRQLPDVPIQLTAFRRTPQGERIRYPSVVRPALNQQDIRIVLDPSLGEGIEDLDAPKRPGATKK